MDISTLGTAIIAFGVMAGTGLIVLFKMVDNKYPPVQIRCHDRGLVEDRKFRQMGSSIVKDNIFKLLMNEFDLVGDIRSLEFFRGRNGNRVYYAYWRHDYLFGFTQDKFIENDNQTVEISSIKPVIVCDKKIKVEFGNSILIPFQLKTINESLTEKEISNGKAICSRFIENEKSNKNYLEASNPFITTFIAALPLLLIILALGITMYLVLTAQTDNLVKLYQSNEKLYDILASKV